MPAATGSKTPTVEDLLDAHQNVLNAERAYELATDRRADTILALLGAGLRQAQIAEALGISRGRVGQLVTARRAELAASENWDAQPVMPR
jgi:DNA-directed RNA polymerase specialized sigma24 family protein